MTPKRCDLLLLPFPFSNLAASKRRPVVALTNPDRYGDFVALAVTSRPQTEYAVALTPAGLAEGVLPAPSWIRTSRVVTLNTSLVVKILGRVSEHIVTEAAKRLCSYLKAPGA